MPDTSSTFTTALPDSIRSLFWDCRVDQLQLSRHHAFIIGRVLTAGTWDQIVSLRRAIGDDVIRQWIVSRQGGPLSPPQLRFWELLLDLPQEDVAKWIRQPERQAWYRGR